MSGVLTRRAYESGNLKEGLIDLGPAVTYVRELQTVEQIFDELLDDARAAHERLHRLMAADARDGGVRRLA
jgi:nitronate monooxygenase